LIHPFIPFSLRWDAATPNLIMQLANSSSIKAALRDSLLRFFITNNKQSVPSTERVFVEAVEQGMEV